MSSSNHVKHAASYIAFVIVLMFPIAVEVYAGYILAHYHQEDTHNLLQICIIFHIIIIPIIYLMFLCLDIDDMQNIFEIYDIGTRVQVLPIAVISFAFSVLDIFVLAFPDTHKQLMTNTDLLGLFICFFLLDMCVIVWSLIVMCS